MDKASLRKEYNAKRQALSEEEVAQQSAVLAEHFFSSFPLKKDVTVHVFLAIHHKKEIHTDLFIKRFTALYPEGRIVVPKMHPENAGQMSCLLWEEGMVLKLNNWGIPEPEKETHVDEFEIDLVLVPLLISDYTGNRVGYGKGYYDQLFMRCREDVIKCGLSLFEPVKEVIDTDVWDVPLDYCVTPSGIHKYKLSH